MKKKIPDSATDVPFQWFILAEVHWTKLSITTTLVLTADSLVVCTPTECFLKNSYQWEVEEVKYDEAQSTLIFGEPEYASTLYRWVAFAAVVDGVLFLATK